MYAKIFEMGKPQKPVLTINQIQRLSNIFDNAGQIVLGVAVVSPIIAKDVDYLVVVLGLITVVFCWLVSMFLARMEEINEL